MQGRTRYDCVAYGINLFFVLAVGNDCKTAVGLDGCDRTFEREVLTRFRQVLVDGGWLCDDGVVRVSLASRLR